MKSKKCKVCSKEFTPKKYAPCKTKCQDCITDFDKEKRFKYLKKQLEKPLKQPSQRRLKGSDNDRETVLVNESLKKWRKSSQRATYSWAVKQFVMS